MAESAKSFHLFGTTDVFREESAKAFHPIVRAAMKAKALWVTLRPQAGLLCGLLYQYVIVWLLNFVQCGQNQWKIQKSFSIHYSPDLADCSVLPKINTVNSESVWHQQKVTHVTCQTSHIWDTTSGCRCHCTGIGITHGALPKASFTLMNSVACCTSKFFGDHKEKEHHNVCENRHGNIMVT